MRDEFESKRLVRVLDAYCTPFPGYYLYYSSRAHLAPKLGALIDFLKQRAAARAPREARRADDSGNRSRLLPTVDRRKKKA